MSGKGTVNRSNSQVNKSGVNQSTKRINQGTIPKHKKVDPDKCNKWGK